jgi:hypothetical protein
MYKMTLKVPAAAGPEKITDLTQFASSPAEFYPWVKMKSLGNPAKLRHPPTRNSGSPPTFNSPAVWEPDSFNQARYRFSILRTSWISLFISAHTFNSLIRTGVHRLFQPSIQVRLFHQKGNTLTNSFFDLLPRKVLDLDEGFKKKNYQEKR